MDWIALNDIAQLDAIDKESFETPCVIFKHSTTCPISYAAKMRVDSGKIQLPNSTLFYYLDLLSYRNISNAIAERYAVHHESPQVLIIKNGECTYEASHLDIRIDELSEQVA